MAAAVVYLARSFVVLYLRSVIELAPVASSTCVRLNVAPSGILLDALGTNVSEQAQWVSILDQGGID
jgi:hypothetical protein